MNNINYDDFINICRTCMIHCDVKFTQDSIISDIFYKLTDIRFEINDDLPQQICLKCYEKINEIHEFAFQCKQTHSNLTKCLNIFKNSRLNQIIEETNEVVEITIDEHEIVPEETNKYLKFKEDIIKEINELNEGIIPETSECNDDSNIILFEDNTCNIEDINKAYLNDLNENTNLSISSNSSNLNSTESSEDKIYKYDVCNKNLINSKSFEKHKYLHSGERPFKNKTPKLLFPSNSLKIHSRERPFKCKQCPKSFIGLRDFKNHLFTHTGERPFKCKQCFKSYTRAGHLKTHVRTHTGERPYKCEHCSKSFITSHNRKEHMRRHSGERPFKCEHCSKSFLRFKVLEQHMHTHNGDRPSLESST